MTLVEATANVVLGNVLAVATQIVVFPWFAIKTGPSEHMSIGLIFITVSLARRYLLRRLFERIRVASHFDDRGENGERAPHRRLRRSRSASVLLFHRAHDGLADRSHAIPEQSDVHPASYQGCR